MGKRPAKRGPAAKGATASGRELPATVRADIPSDFAHSRELQQKILEKLHESRYNEDDIFAIRISLEEALVNAIRHGNRMDAAKQVHVSYSITPTKAEFYIEDEGAGFDRRRVPDPTCDENLEKCSGRGILLMEAYMDKVQFDRNGRRLHMVKRRHNHAARRT